MVRSWEEVKAEKEVIDRAAGRDVAAARAEAHRRTAERMVGYRLAELRQQAGLTQTDIARIMGVSQARISQLEHGDAHQLEVDTIRRYVTALGGALKIVVDFADHEVTIAS
ncbi:putative transcriptional regulator [Kibdelosporangium banguiense]|uniref:Transcriptional regulator n=1 Tax=Kibdelosporangium banguiense TaxID=1365924 RepID=A0ABS4T5J8_9PSEU|nr:XRE family transcriptional regulator [Kibdelosporangium banguiense]MBP2319727.1 putative transcriptional regulator [Kibdelosporangium banguiense]